MEINCRFIRTEILWESGRVRRAKFLASFDRQIRTTPKSSSPLGSRLKRKAHPSAFGPRDDSSNCGATRIRSGPVRQSLSRSDTAEYPQQGYIYFSARVKR